MLVHFIGSIGAWTVKPYERCSFGCVYCISHSQGKSTPRCPENRVGNILTKELDSVDPSIELGLGAIAEAYPQPPPERYARG